MVPENKIDSDIVRDLHRVWHPCTQHKDYETVPPILVERAEGIYLYDRQGNRYLDVIASWWVNLFGHNHPRLNEALTAQLDKMAHVMFAGITHQPAIDLADALVRLSPKGFGKVFFSDNGSTSVEVALKMSLQYWRQTGKAEKTQFAYLKGGYHGETLGALSVCGLDIFRTKFEKVLAPNLPVDGPDCFRCPYGLQRESCNAECFEPMEKTLCENADRVAGVIVEPLVQGAAGMMMYPPVYLKKLQAICESLEIHLIFDEIAVGFGRTGSLFVCEAHDLQPTFLCLSKGITSGYLPLSATLTSDKIYSAFYGDRSDLFIHSHSYSANPLACAVANETLKMLTENNFLQTLKPKIAAIKEGGKLFDGLAGEFRQTGMIAAMELVKDKKEKFSADKRVGYQIFLEGLKRGLFLRPLGDVVYFIPPLVITEEEIAVMLTTARDCIHAVLKKG
ncbi:MAG: adenosylmethionine--8-amino-7-oxononanoate transaminase [Nitrospinaceae bacterium]|nr:adenosylmethionine--8-amino-7-oxononanoate transaminase [Nitrospina sp.]MBT5376912.1 adenosylmethionine--8-amino-7-oxononanoate transaminase [Nitrospinaceae bacterium]MBT5868749.1 adenosylmethionine--8-amino-7-oxononanoate transaminase [Nitrospinaceae bacterium]MBT6345599.1 adenosylmethionine--8-amino-7-oxononanoate transaminase [Nitrospina sp.]